jgi:hypothetical protein
MMLYADWQEENKYCSWNISRRYSLHPRRAVASPLDLMRLRVFAPPVHSKLYDALSMDTSVVMWDGRHSVVS